MIPLTTTHVLLEVTVPGAQSTLQDFKLPESGGGYTYDESNSWLSPTSNRFIVWYAFSSCPEMIHSFSFPIHFPIVWYAFSSCPEMIHSFSFPIHFPIVWYAFSSCPEMIHSFSFVFISYPFSYCLVCVLF